MNLEPSSDGIKTADVFPYFDNFKVALADRRSNTEYDPHKNVSCVHEIGSRGAAFHLIRAAIGASILLAPFAFSLVGYGVAIATVFFTIILYVNSLHSLLWVEYQLCKILKVPHLTFVGVVEGSFDLASKNLQIFRPFMKFCIYLYWAVPSANGIYLLVISDSCRKILYNHFDRRYSLESTIPVVLVFMMVLCLLPRLKFLVPFSLLASILTLLNLVTVSVLNIDMSRWMEAKLIGDLTNVPRVFAIFVYSVGMTAMVLPLKNEMQNPKEFASNFGILNVSFGLLSLAVTSFGLVGYLNYGSCVQDNILSNLPAGHWVTSIVSISYTLSLCVSYTLIFYAYEDTIWNGFLAAKLKGSRYEAVCKYGLRVSINVTAYGMAVVVPNFGLLVSILGTMGILMELCLPSVLHLLACQLVPTKPTALSYVVVKISVTVTLSVIIFAMNIKTCISDLIKLHRKR